MLMGSVSRRVGFLGGCYLGVEAFGVLIGWALFPLYGTTSALRRERTQFSKYLRLGRFGVTFSLGWPQADLYRPFYISLYRIWDHAMGDFIEYQYGKDISRNRGVAKCAI